MRIHTHHIISMQTKIYLIDVLGDSSQFNRAMSESGVHDKRSIQLGGKWPSTTPQMTIYYSSQSNSLQEKAK